MAKRKKTRMSPQHKKALAAGRQEGAAVRRYLQALEDNKPRRGRRRTPDSIRRRLTKIDREISAAAAIQRVQLVQERLDLNTELERLSGSSDVSADEKQFVKVAKAYSARKGISYAAWREVGVPADVLRRAGITRGGG